MSDPEVKDPSLSIKRRMLIDTAIKIGKMNPDDVAKLLHVTREYVYRVIRSNK